MVSMFDYAFKQNPANEELGIQSFFANLRTSNWKAGQQVRLTSIQIIRVLLLVENESAF